MPNHEKELDRLLALVAEHLDLDHCQVVDQRYRAVFNYDDVDRPILVTMSESPFGSGDLLPEPWDAFRFYGYEEAFFDPVKMMQNQLLDKVVPGLILGDDNPLSIRNNHGTIQIASILGADWGMYKGNYPWVKPMGAKDAVRAIVETDRAVSENDGVLSRSFETLRFYHEKLSQFPPCREGIQISLPDLQGPMDVAEQLWGSSIYYAFYDDDDLLDRLLGRIAGTIATVSGWFRRHATDRLDPFANTQHGYVIPGRLLDRIDSSIMVSAEMYAERIRPHDAWLLNEVGGGSCHSCGNWDHLVDRLLEIPHLLGLDFGDPNAMALDRIYRKCRERKVVLANLLPDREDLTSGRAAEDFPTGVIFVYMADSFGDAHQVVSAYYRR